MSDRSEELTASPRETMPRIESPIVPRSSISGRALIAVVAIMTFLASLTTGAVVLVRASASEWQSDLSREITIQIRPAPDRDLEAAAKKTSEIVRAFPGVSDVRIYSRDESAKLLEPWLGTGLALEELPVPRILAVRMSREANDLAPLRKALADQVTGATLDDHRAWNERMRAMANTTVAAGLGLLILMLAATILSVTFATRGAMAATRAVIEVLHFVGARNDYIAGRFQRHFLVLGLQGGVLGGGAAMLIFVLAGFLSRPLAGTAAGDEAAALFGSFAIGPLGYLAVAVQVVLIAAVTAFTSRHTVNRTLDTID